MSRPRATSTQPPSRWLRKMASITSMLQTASSIGVGTAVSLRMAWENRSPWMVYWSQVGMVSVSIRSPCWWKIRQGRSCGALKGISISTRPVRADNVDALVGGRSWVEQVKVDVPPSKSRIAEASRSVRNLGSKFDDAEDSSRLGGEQQSRQRDGVAADVASARRRRCRRCCGCWSRHR